MFLNHKIFLSIFSLSVTSLFAEPVLYKGLGVRYVNEEAGISAYFGKRGKLQALSENDIVVKLRQKQDNPAFHALFNDPENVIASATGLKKHFPSVKTIKGSSTNRWGIHYIL